MIVAFDIFSILIILAVVFVAYHVLAKFLPFLIQIIVVPLALLFFIIIDFFMKRDINLKIGRKHTVIKKTYKNVKADVEKIMLDFNDNIVTHEDFNIVVKKRKELQQLINIADDESKGSLNESILKVQTAIEKRIGYKL